MATINPAIAVADAFSQFFGWLKQFDSGRKGRKDAEVIKFMQMAIDRAKELCPDLEKDKLFAKYEKVYKRFMVF